MQKPGGTLKDIAKALNISSGTVSRVLNGRGDLAQDTREKVFSLAAELNYLPRRRREPTEAAGLTRVSLCIGNPCAASDGTLDPSFVGFHLLNAVQQAATKTGVGLLVGFADAMAEDFDAQKLPALRPDEAQGILLAYPFPERVVRRLSARQPVVSIEHIYPGLSLDVVGPTHALDVMNAVDLLYQYGHRRIAYVGDECATGHRLTQGLRHAGFISGMARVGLPYRPADVLNFHGQTTTKEHLPEAIAKLARDGVTAVISSIDRHGYLLWDQLPSLGISVPGDMSLVGIGGIHRMVGQRQLTTWRCDYDGIATAALELICQRLRGRQPRDQYRELQSTFTPGHTVAAANR